MIIDRSGWLSIQITDWIGLKSNIYLIFVGMDTGDCIVKSALFL